MSKLLFISLLTIALAGVTFDLSGDSYVDNHTGEGTIPTRDYMNLKNSVSIPQSFDSRTKWPGCIGRIDNIGSCASDWAFAAIEVLSDRYCIQNQESVLLSPQYLISCVGGDNGCHGGNTA